MSVVVILLLAAMSEPPPWPETLKCAAHSQAAAELAKDGPDAGKTFDHAMFWSFAAMDRAQRDRMKAADAESAQKVERARVKPLLAARDPAAEAVLASCLAKVPRI